MSRQNTLKLTFIKLNKLIDSGNLTPVDEFKCVELLIEIDRELNKYYS